MKRISPRIPGHSQAFQSVGGIHKAACSCGWESPEASRRWPVVIAQHDAHKAEVVGTEVWEAKVAAAGKSHSTKGSGGNSAGKVDLTEAYVAGWGMFGWSSVELAQSLGCTTGAATRAMRKLEKLGAVTEEHVNGDREITWQVLLRSIDDTNEEGARRDITDLLAGKTPGEIHDMRVAEAMNAADAVLAE